MDYPKTVQKYVYTQYHKDKKRKGINMYDTHVKYVVEYAKELAHRLDADEEITEIAALLHDIGRLNGTEDNHHIIGADIAEQYLRSIDYPEDKIQKVKHCIIAHRGSKQIPRETKEAECVASADAMTHFRNISDMFYFVYHDLQELPEKGKQMVMDKLERSYRKMIPEAKRMVNEKYEALKIILS